MSDNRYPWLKEYRVFGIPENLEPYPAGPVHHILETAAVKYPDMGLICNGGFIAYPRVFDHSARLGAALLALGLKKGDRVATMLPTSVPFVTADYALSMAGLVHMPVSFLDSAESLSHKYASGGPRALVCLDEYAEAAAETARSSGIAHIITAELDYYDASVPASRTLPAPAGTLSMRELIAETGPMEPESSIDAARDLETLLFTGGTTGIAKGCMLSHRNIYANAMQNSYAVGQIQQTVRGAASVVLGIPFFHSYGHVIMHSMTLLGFNQILIPDPRDLKGMAAAIREYRPVVQIGVPTQFMKLAGADLKEGMNMLAISGSAALPPSVQKEYEEKHGGSIMEGYGLSEMSSVTHLNTTVLVRLFGGRLMLRLLNTVLGIPAVGAALNRLARYAGSRRVGRFFRVLNVLVRKTFAGSGPLKAKEKRGSIGLPGPDTAIKVLDTETGRALPWRDISGGCTGELCLSGPQRMIGYWPEAGSGMDGEGFVHTGDIVRVDRSGYFYIVDRAKDMINVSGYKVYSREIDDLLQAHAGIERAAAIGIPDPAREGSERVVVYVQPRPGTKGPLSEEEVLEYLRTRVAKYALPKAVRIVRDIPLTEIQKVDKKKLRERAAADFR